MDIKENIAKAEKLFRREYTCSQAVLGAFSEDFGLDMGMAIKLARPFGAGYNWRGEVCGAVSGAMLVYGLALADESPSAEGKNSLVRQACAEHFRLFEERFGAMSCSKLLGHNIGTDQGYKEVSRLGLFEDRCPEIVRGTVEIVEFLLSKYM